MRDACHISFFPVRVGVGVAHRVLSTIFKSAVADRRQRRHRASEPGWLQAYFTDRLIGQRAASPNTIGAYKLTFRLLLTFASKRLGKTPAALDIAELDAPLIGAFLDHLERERGNSAATGNNRLAAIHSLFGYLALQHPEHAGSPARSRHRA
jgi:site-specific recombinase XerD